MLKNGTRNSPRGRSGSAITVPAWRWFFPLAALHAALLVPLSLLSLYHLEEVALLSFPAAHGRELLFGFALTVIAGYLLGPLSPRWLMVLVGLWLVARLGGLARCPVGDPGRCRLRAARCLAADPLVPPDGAPSPKA